MGERWARWGFGYQDKVCTERILTFLRDDFRNGTSLFQGVRLADPKAGRVDDFVLIWKQRIEANAIKWSERPSAINWGDLVGASGLLRDLAKGWKVLRQQWPDRQIFVRLHTNRSASVNKHHRQPFPSLSVDDFVAKYWALGPDATRSQDACQVWCHIANHVGLSKSDFSEFVRHCELAFSQSPILLPGRLTYSQSSYYEQFDRLHKAIATWLTNHPTSGTITRNYLLSAIGLHPTHFDLLQHFPDPELPYEQNHAAAVQLKTIVDNTKGGYLAIVGAAGVGKSTLVQSVLTNSSYPLFVPYYAFLPGTPGNRDRAEALTFFEDVVMRLDRFHDVRRSLGVATVAQGRAALRECMSSAHGRYLLDGHKTILLIDGIDHAMREVGLQTPVLRELPHPDDIPRGFLIILSGQPQAFLPGNLPASVVRTVNRDSTRLEVTGLSRQEVHTLVSRIGKSTTGKERDALYAASLGNPLILTYLLSLFKRTDDTSVKRTVGLAGPFTGSIDEYYHERLAVPLQDPKRRQLLGLLCRAAPTLPIEWFATWPEKNEIQDIYQRTLAPFVQVRNGQLRFIHDSLIAFLRTETRSRLPTSDPVTDERSFYSILADRSIGRSSLDPVGRARILYLVRANRHADALTQMSSSWLRHGMSQFVPYTQVRPIVLAGYTAAATMENWAHTLRLILLDYELIQRASRLEAIELARALLNLDKPILALSQIRSEGRLLVDDNIALEFAGTMWRYSHRQNTSELRNAARELYLQAKPLTLINAGEPIKTDHFSDQLSVLTSWSHVAALFEDLSLVSHEIRGLVFTSTHTPHRPSPLTVKARLLFNVLKVALSVGYDLPCCQRLVKSIQLLGSATWHFRALLQLVKSAPQTVRMDSLRQAYGLAERDHDTDLEYAWYLNEKGDTASAKEIVFRLPQSGFELGQDYWWDSSNVIYTVRLQSLKELVGASQGVDPVTTNEHLEVRLRVERTAKRLGSLFVLAERGQIRGDRHAMFRSLLLFHNRPVHTRMVNPTQSFALEELRNSVYEQISELAKVMGGSGICVLRDVVIELFTGPTATQFTPDHRRQFALLFYEEEVMCRDQAVSLGLSSTADVDDEDPTQRQDACLKIAMFLHRMGDCSRSQHWIQRAGSVSAGASSHKDYHMADVANWLARSITRVAPERLAVLDRFSRAIEVSGGQGGPDGAVTALQLITCLGDSRAWQLATEYIDRDVLSVSDTLKALIGGGVEGRADPELLIAIYGELYSLIAPDDTSHTAVAVLTAFPRQQQNDAARRMVSYVRTNALPSHRATVVRALEDAIRLRGSGPITLARGLRPGRDDSSRTSTLYRLKAGDVETQVQVAERLSDPDCSHQWNPNPEDNSDFDWWAAIGKAKVRDQEHLDRLVANFPPPEYRKVERLVREADVLLRLGKRKRAKEVIERAISGASEGSWHRRVDGAQKVMVYRRLKQFDHAEGLDRAKQQFWADLKSGKLWSSEALYDIRDILEVLEVDWPCVAALDAVNDYIKQILGAHPTVRPYEALLGDAPSWSVNQTLCRFVCQLLAIPVVDVAVAARRVLTRYVSAGGGGLLALLTTQPWWKSMQLENILAAIHIGLTRGSPNLANLRRVVERLGHSESLAVRSVAKRICDYQDWGWENITTVPAQPVIFLADAASPRNDTRFVLGGDARAAWHLYGSLIVSLTDARQDIDELYSEFNRVYWALEEEYPWTSDDRLIRWRRQLSVRDWIRPRAIIGREAAMVVVGRRVSSGQGSLTDEDAYDRVLPIYDSYLEVLQPSERPVEFTTGEWSSRKVREDAWYQGGGTKEWRCYPDAVGSLPLIGERTWFVRPDWEWPCERRYRGVVAIGDHSIVKRDMDSEVDLTYESYLDGRGQDPNQLIVFNNDRQLAGPAYRWVAINSNFARALGWLPSTESPFRWLDDKGSVMVESTYWKDGWIWIGPPTGEVLGEGWYVTASPCAIEAIRRRVPQAETHLWVERRSRGNQQHKGQWHLYRPL